MSRRRLRPGDYTAWADIVRAAQDLLAAVEAQPHLQVTAPALQGVRLLLARVHDDLHALAQDLRPPKAEQGESEGGAA